MLKKLIIIFTLTISFFALYSQTNAITVKVTEALPIEGCSDTKVDGYYKCEFTNGIDAFLATFRDIIKYVTYIASLAGVLMIVGNGIMLSMGGIDSGAKEKAKERIIKTIIGLVLLLMSGIILYIVAPWVYV